MASRRREHDPCCSVPSGGRRLEDALLGFALTVILAVLGFRSGTKGSDVRVSTGELMLPSTVRFQSARSDWWHWEVAFGYQWKKSAHINEPEVRGALLDLQQRAQRTASIGQRYFCLLDSYVALGVHCKKRSIS